MLVEGAERFGLAQLHQLRGRVGRGGRPARCFLMASRRAPALLRACTPTHSSSHSAAMRRQLDPPGLLAQHGPAPSERAPARSPADAGRAQARRRGAAGRAGGEPQRLRDRGGGPGRARRGRRDRPAAERARRGGRATRGAPAGRPRSAGGRAARRRARARPLWRRPGRLAARAAGRAAQPGAPPGGLASCDTHVHAHAGAGIPHRVCCTAQSCAAPRCAALEPRLCMTSVRAAGRSAQPGAPLSFAQQLRAVAHAAQWRMQPCATRR